MKLVEIEIRGTSPLLTNRFSEASETKKGVRPMENGQRRDPRAEATCAAYIAPDGKFYVPSGMITGALRQAGANHKMRSSRKSLRYLVPCAVRPSDDTITILDEKGKPATDFEVDTRPVSIPATKGRILRHRPRWNFWTAKFSLCIQEQILSTDDVHMLLNEAGERIGIGDYRPTCTGSFGCFHVTSFQEAKA